MKTEHTLTPWYIPENTKNSYEIKILSETERTNGTLCLVAIVPSKEVSLNQQKANAEHIVKCVNMHAELLTAVKDCKKLLKLHSEKDLSWIDIIISKSEGK